ncbi:MAG: transcription-repair coupling factor [Gammaproteobacteria bacterium]|nr:transcription-repair coupling factor [Gammaproteobacteria bacterium]
MDTKVWGQLHGAAGGSALAKAITRAQQPFIIITTDMHSAHRLQAELQFFLNNQQDVIIFPDWETLPYDTFSPHEDIISLRLQTLSRLPYLTSGALLVPATTLMYPLIPRAYLQAHSLQLKTGQTLDSGTLRHDLTTVGYQSVAQVMHHGEFALRGSIIDIFPMGADAAYRIDLLDAQIDSIRTFDPESQRSLNKIAEINLLPARECLLTEVGRTQFRHCWKEYFPGSGIGCPVYEAISSGLSTGGIEYYLPLFYKHYATLFDYLPAQSIIVQCGDIPGVLHKFWHEIKNRYEQYRHDVTRPLLAPTQLFSTPEQVLQYCKQYPQIKLHEDAVIESGGHTNFYSEPLPDVNFQHKTAEPLHNLQQLIKQRTKVLLLAETLGRREALFDLFRPTQIRPIQFANWPEFLASDAPLGITVAPLERGLNTLEPDVVVIAESQLYGERVMQRRLRQPETIMADNGLRDLAELQIGKLVVHLDHGIGRYVGLQTITTDNRANEYVTLEYADNAKLYVPVHNLHLLSRYREGANETTPVHRLGTEQWSKAKQKAAEKARDVAAELLDLYARRAAKPGMEYQWDEAAYQTFAGDFPFEETADQLRAINDVMNDMRAPKPMDRLLCGDVGFGKTEVAMRAAFVAVQNHKQVAILVPTTLLAEQHYNSFKDRFANWPIKTALLSRFRTAKEQTQTVEQLANGKVDIVIATHKLLQSGLQFSDLGLLIIDEEHRFGVRQKEQLKALRTNVDILTLTATPIPRTLNMAFAQMRDLSMIFTPPARRLSIKTFVQQYNKENVREAIWREILRGGQVYFLHNNVATINKTAQELAELIPEAKIAIAHGQMRERDLEQTMIDFYHQRFNVLVCTTIIETGIDVPSANTIIMDRADKLGLAQLHQLRGRVGRSHHQAYAYLLTPPENLISADAVKRLEAISQAHELGAGFSLATQDLEIRGAGELLGEEQSGQIATVGFSLYMEFLNHAVNSLRSGVQPDFTKPMMAQTEVDLTLSAIIPDDYLPDVSMRLVLYKRIANAKSERQLRDLQVEMIDRFGLLPEATKNLFTVAEIKLLAQELGISKIILGAEGGYLEFTKEPKIDPLKIIQLIQQTSRQYKLQGPQRLNLVVKLPSPSDRFKFIRQLLQQLSN